jgi:hypothetical protein
MGNTTPKPPPIKSCVFILQLADGKYYVGRSTDLDTAWITHTSGKGVAWTRKYAPMRITYSEDPANGIRENELTIRLIKIYGIDNVRGGSFSDEILSEGAINLIEGIIGHAYKADDTTIVIDIDGIKKSIAAPKNPEIEFPCPRCGFTGHDRNQCRAQHDIAGFPL